MMFDERESRAHLLEHIYYAIENREAHTFDAQQMQLLFRMLHETEYLRETFDCWDDVFSNDKRTPNKYRPGDCFMKTETDAMTYEQAHKLLDDVEQVVEKVERDLRFTTIAMIVQTVFVWILCAYVWFA